MLKMASCALLLLAASLGAQSQVIPADFATTGAPSSTAWPLGLSTTCRLQYLYGAGETGLQAPTMIRSLNLRANQTSTNVAKTGIGLQISMSTTATTVGTASTTFAANHGANLSVAYTRKATNINATTPQNPGMFAGVMPLDTPFLYIPSMGNLLIDFDIDAHMAGTWAHDTPFTSVGTHANVGTACAGLNATSTGGALGGPLTLGMTGGQPNGIGVLLLGITALATPIPIPGNPGCFLYNDIVFLDTVTLSATGAASVPLTVPPDSNLRDGIVYAQFAALNAAQNFDMTQSRQVTLRSWVVLRVHNTSNNASPTGTIQNYVGIVIELGL